MAKPRVFVSSTYYDLKSVRADLEHFIRDRGYDPVLNERGNIAYSKESAPEQACYREIESSDILVSIIGGRFGSSSQAGPYSISQMELKNAIEQYKQVYIFVERDVLAEFRTYQKNKEAEVTWVSVDNAAIFKFLDEVFALPNNNAIMPFDTSHDIVNLLREQWSGLFQRMLQNATAEGQVAAARELRQGIDTVRRLVELLTTNKIGAQEAAQEAVKSILLPNHPAFRRIQRLAKVPYRVFFTNLDELKAWLKARNFKAIDDDAWDESDFMEWHLTTDAANWDLMKVSTSLFDESGRFIPNEVQWDENLIRREVRAKEFPDLDDEPPF